MPPYEMTTFQYQFGAALAGGGDGRVLDIALARALAVHRNTSAKAAQDALAANYPVVRALCGDDAFQACAGAFVRRHPPREPRLNAFGQGFAAFLHDYEPTRGLAYLSDVARVERLFNEALFAADAQALDADAMAQGLSEGSVLRLHPATRFQLLASPAVSIWLAHQGQQQPDFRDLTWAPQGVLVTRPRSEVRVTIANAGLCAFLQACAAGADLGAAALAANAVGADLATLLPTLIEAGAFA